MKKVIVTSRKVLWLFLEQLRPERVPLFHRLQRRFTAVWSQNVMAYNLVRITRRHYGTNSSWQRQDHARRASADTAIEGFERGAEPEIRDQRQNRVPVAVRFWQCPPFTAVFGYIGHRVDQVEVRYLDIAPLNRRVEMEQTVLLLCNGLHFNILAYFSLQLHSVNTT